MTEVGSSGGAEDTILEAEDEELLSNRARRRRLYCPDNDRIAVAVLSNV